MKTLTNKHTEKLAQVVEGLFNIEAPQITSLHAEPVNDTHGH